MKLRALCLVFVLLISSCANIPSGYKFDPSNSEGLIVGSITYDGSLGLYSMVISSPQLTHPPKINVGYGMWPPLTPQFDEGLKAVGGTFAVSVPAGEYKIQAWQVTQGYRTRESFTPIDIVFTVEKGKATYLGNLHFSRKLEVSLRDRSARDLPVLQEKYEVLRSAPLTFTIAKDADLRDLGRGYQTSYEIPVFIPVPGRR